MTPEEKSCRIGTRLGYIAALLNHKKDLKQARFASASASRRCQQDVLEILCVLQSGRHCSVGLGASLTEAPSRSPNLIGRPQLMHLSRPVWSHMPNWRGLRDQREGEEPDHFVSRIADWMIAEGSIYPVKP